MRCGVVLAGVVTVVGLYGMVARPSLDRRLAPDDAAPAGPLATPSAPAPADLDELRARLTQIMQRENIAGAGIALIVGGEVVWTGGIGLADRERGIPVTADTLFRVGSITKSFIVLALMRLVEQGHLALDAPVAQLVPEIAIENRWEREQPITVAQLLEHTSGFDDMRPNETLAPLDAETLPLRDVLARNPASRVARWRPGSRAAYSNPGYTVAGYILEKLTGRAYEDVIARELFQPLGMTGAALRMTPDVHARLARGYDERDRAVDYRAIYHRPAGSLMISPRDLATLVRLGIARGRANGVQLISPASMDRIERSETSQLDPGDARYGLGNWGDVSSPVVMRGHGGYQPGFLSMYGYSAARGFGYVLLLNSSYSHDGRTELRRVILDYLLRGQAIPPPPRAKVPDSELARWTGSYHFAAPRMQFLAFHERMLPGVEVFLEHGRLFSRQLPGSEPPVELIPTGDDHFREPWASGSYVAFGRDHDGRRSFVAGHDYFVEEPRSRTLLFALGSSICLVILATGLLLPLTTFRRRAGPSPSTLWPITVSLSLVLAPYLFAAGFDLGVLGGCNAYTVALFVLSLVFPIGSLATAVQALAWLRRPGSLVGKLHRLLFATAACCATAYLAAYGMIGVRMWSY